MNNLDIQEHFIYSYPIKYRKPLKIAVLYPNTYFIGMSNLGFQTLYHYLNLNSMLNISRFFFNEDDSKFIYSPDKKFNLDQSDIIFVSQSFELDSLNFIKILVHNKIDPFKNHRKSYPIIIIGGVFPSINSEIYKDIVDITFKGELEVIIHDLNILLCKFTLYNKIQFIEELKTIIIKKNSKFQICNIIENSIPAHSAIISNHTTFNDTLLVEISRGCKYNCSFCLVTNLYKKFRSYNKNKILEIVRKGLKFTNKVGLVSALTTEYPDLKELILVINKIGCKVSFSSLRVDQIDDEILELLANNNQHTLTIAPETSSRKIKKNIGKNINNQKVFEIIEKSLKYGIKNIKIYFIIGFEFEDEETIDNNIEYIKKVKNVILKSPYNQGWIPHITVSISPFIPKPQTKMENVKMLDHNIIKKRIRRIKKEILPLGGITIKSESPKLSVIQSIISKGNSDVGKFLIDLAYKNENIRQLLRLNKK